MTAPRMRAGTSDRQAAADGLARHFTEGRLDANEFYERVGIAYAATYLDELPELFSDLPEAYPRRGTGSGAHRRGPGGVVPFLPAAPPGPWSGRPRTPLHRPPRILAVAMLAAMFLIGVLTHGLFLFPLIWVVFFLMFSGGDGHRHHRANPSAPNNNRW